jgi:hypothetical protein
MVEPRLTAQLEDAAGTGKQVEWHAEALRCLASQLGVANDFYFPLLGAATLLDGNTTVKAERLATENN